MDNDNQTIIVHDEAALQAVETIQETSSPVQRSYGLSIRLIPLTIVWIILAWGVVQITGMRLPIGIFVFTVLTAFTFYKLNEQDHQHSAAGIERLKVDKAAALKALELANRKEVQLKALEIYVRQLEKSDD